MSESDFHLKYGFNDKILPLYLDLIYCAINDTFKSVGLFDMTDYRVLRDKYNKEKLRILTYELLYNFAVNNGDISLDLDMVADFLHLIKDYMNSIKSNPDKWDEISYYSYMFLCELAEEFFNVEIEEMYNTRSPLGMIP